MLIRPPNIVVGGHILPGYFFSFLFFPQLHSQLAERNSTKICHMVGNEYSLKTHVQNLGYTLPCKSGVQNPLFRRLRNSTATLTAYIFGTKHNIHKRLQTPPCVNSAFYFIVRLRRRTPANGTQPNFVKRRTLNRANNLL